jgi:hypothetical protein
MFPPKIGFLCSQIPFKKGFAVFNKTLCQNNELKLRRIAVFSR